MNEVKTPKKNWFYYYTIVLLILIILNTFIMPLIQQHSVKEVDYGTFISMTEKKEIGKVEIAIRLFSRIRMNPRFTRPV